MTKQENGAEAIMRVLHEAGCDEIKVTQVIDHEAAVIALYGVELNTGRVFACLAYQAAHYIRTAAEELAAAIFTEYLDWIDAGRPKWWGMRGEKICGLL